MEIKSDIMCLIFLTFAPFSCTSTAQVPDDEQFVPDFQSDSCEYLIFILIIVGL